VAPSVASATKSGSDLCLCGSGKKTDKCHGSGAPLPSVNGFKLDERIDEPLYALAMNVTEALKLAIEAIRVDRNNRDETMHRACVSFHARKMYRATLAGLTLIRYDQSTQALTLKREQYYSWVAFHYYLMNRDDAVLFMASQPLRQRDDAVSLTEIVPGLRDDPRRREQFKRLEEQRAEAYREFPALRRPKGRSAKSSAPLMIDWSEPSTATMLRAMVREWPKEMAAAGEAPPEGDLDAWVERQARETHFYHGYFMSQDVHGTPLAINDAFRELDNDSLGPVSTSTNEPNGLIYIYLWYPLGVLGSLVKAYKPRGLKDRTIKLQKAALAQKERHGG
jgi:hypothetical protein